MAVSVLQRYCGTVEVDIDLQERAKAFLTASDIPEHVLYSKADVRSLFTQRKSYAPSQSKDGAGLNWLKAFRSYDGDKCLLYPFATAANPRGSLRYNFKEMEAHRAMCLMVNKLPDNPKAMALHRCGNGHLGCVTPKHLYWGDASKNAQDAAEHRRGGKPEVEPFRKIANAKNRRKANRSARKTAEARKLASAAQ
jgi:hypothetical protein